MTVAKKEQQQNNGVGQFIRDTRAELKKVVWPTREEATRLTLVVLAVSTVIGSILFVADSFFLALYTALVNFVQTL